MHIVISVLLFIDSLIPFVLHDPILAIRYHLAQSSSLYSQSIVYAKTDPNEAVHLATHAQNHMTLLDGNIQQLANAKDVPYADIQTAFQRVANNQNTLLANLPKSYFPIIIQLQSFEKRTRSSIKKLYYESLLP